MRLSDYQLLIFRGACFCISDSILSEGNTFTSDWQGTSFLLARSLSSSSIDSGRRNEIVFVDGLKRGNTPRLALDQSTKSVESCSARDEVPVFCSGVLHVVGHDERMIEEPLLGLMGAHLVRLPVLVDVAFVPIGALELRQRHRFHVRAMNMMMVCELRRCCRRFRVVHLLDGPRWEHRCRRVYTARPLAAALGRDIEFMWLSGEQRPNMVTVADFRRRLNGTIKEILKEIVGPAMRGAREVATRPFRPRVSHVQ